jgi:D-cysteine desulfhydrase
LREHGAALPVGPPTARDLTIETGFVGSGYGHGTSEAESAMRLARERAGLELEPVYTGKAMAGLIELNRRGAFGSGPVLFVNTHGPRDL